MRTKEPVTELQGSRRINNMHKVALIVIIYDISDYDDCVGVKINLILLSMVIVHCME